MPAEQLSRARGRVNANALEPSAEDLAAISTIPTITTRLVCLGRLLRERGKAKPNTEQCRRETLSARAVRQVA